MSEQQSELFGESVEQLQDCLSKLSSEDAAEVRKRWPSNLQSLALLIEAELNKAKVNEPQLIGAFLAGLFIKIISFVDARFLQCVGAG